MTWRYRTGNDEVDLRHIREGEEMIKAATYIVAFLDDENTPALFRDLELLMALMVFREKIRRTVDGITAEMIGDARPRQ